MRGVRTDPEAEHRVLELYRQGLSENKIAEALGISNSTAHAILVRNHEPRRSISEALMKYPKTDFRGDPVEKAQILAFLEDCAAREDGRQIQIETDTTHPAMIELFNDTLKDYGHLGSWSRYNHRSRFHTYQWHLQALLNQSFGFVLEYKRNPSRFLTEVCETGTQYDYIGSLMVEGSVIITVDHGNAVPVLAIANRKLQLLRWVQEIVGGEVYPSGDIYQLILRYGEAVDVVRKLPMKHPEKAAARELILRHADNGGVDLECLWEYRAFRRKIDEEVRLCTMQARLDWIRRHGKPHSKDPNQTVSDLPLSPSFS